MAEITTDGNQPDQSTVPPNPNAEAQGAPALDSASASSEDFFSQSPLDAGTAYKAEADGEAAARSNSFSEAPAETMQAPTEEEDPVETITWTASEFIAHSKSTGWYGLLALVAVALSGLVYLITRGDLISTGMVVVGAILFGIVAARQPRELQFQLDGHGIQIGSRRYGYGAFRSFSVVPEGAFSSIVFMPLKRFSPLTTIYFAPEDEQRIVDLLTHCLPYQEYRHDLFDDLMRRIRF